ncbi:ATP-dependent DNA helicase [Nephila pilipes]|uniref:ATP-dependent DNA helicase n=1 Tax=Nephila pilipes TaxID=299642 RepID=A0A8X6TSU9_NEPPI|nr:ATP-dependent DNA helicase [Nephila pilipes]
MAVRSRPACVSVPYIIAANDSENYYYSLLLQYVSYLSEDELLDGFNSAREAFQAREGLLREQCEMMEIYRERNRLLEMGLNRAHAFELLNREPEPLHCDDIVEILKKNKGMKSNLKEQSKQLM